MEFLLSLARHLGVASLPAVITKLEVETTCSSMRGSRTQLSQWLIILKSLFCWPHWQIYEWGMLFREREQNETGREMPNKINETNMWLRDFWDIHVLHVCHVWFCEGAMHWSVINNSKNKGLCKKVGVSCSSSMQHVGSHGPQMIQRNNISHTDRLHKYIHCWY